MMRMDTVVLELEAESGTREAIIRYPEALCCQLVDVAHDAIRRDGEVRGRSKKALKQAKRKAARKLNAGELSQQEYHLKIRDRLTTSYSRLLQAGQRCGYFPVQQPKSALTQSLGLDLAGLCELDSLVPASDSPTCIISEGSSFDPFGHLVQNTTGKDVTVKLWEKRFCVPCGSSFLLSDFKKIGLLADSSAAIGKRYDLIVIDPPWENRSAIRGRKYQWLSRESLLDIPIPDLASHEALVAVWVTNKRQLAHFVTNELFTAWGVEPVGEWHWIKITTTGALVFNMDSNHKKPYETLILGRFKGGSDEGATPTVTKGYTACMEGSGGSCLDSLDGCETTAEGHRWEDSASHTQALYNRPATKFSTSHTHMNSGDEQLLMTSQDTFAEDRVNMLVAGEPPVKRCRLSSPVKTEDSSDICTAAAIPQYGVFLCVPSKIHSKKPYLGDLLLKYLPEKNQCLELFARNLLPSWTSWGNEVLKFQELPKEDT